MKVSVNRRISTLHLVGFAVYVSVLFCGSYYKSSKFKNLNPPLLGMGGVMAIGGGVLAFNKRLPT